MDDWKKIQLGLRRGDYGSWDEIRARIMRGRKTADVAYIAYTWVKSGYLRPVPGPRQAFPNQ